MEGRKPTTRWTPHQATFPIPFPLTEQEKADLAEQRVAAGASSHDPLAGVDLTAVALERASKAVLPSIGR